MQQDFDVARVIGFNIGSDGASGPARNLNLDGKDARGKLVEIGDTLLVRLHDNGRIDLGWTRDGDRRADLDADKGGLVRLEHGDPEGAFLAGEKR